MRKAVKQFLDWYGKRSPNDEFVEDWLQVAWWRVFLTAFAIGFVPATILLDRLFF